jgi:hypothetical protein
MLIHTGILLRSHRVVGKPKLRFANFLCPIRSHRFSRFIQIGPVTRATQCAVNFGEAQVKIVKLLLVKRIWITDPNGQCFAQHICTPQWLPKHRILATFTHG